MNPNAGFHSGPDVVLLFETAGGWNQSGGRELLTTERHGGCNVAFADGSVRLVKPDELGTLRWRDAGVPGGNPAGDPQGAPESCL
jgi:prepilin-type processing-associated H-X9-DG protein